MGSGHPPPARGLLALEEEKARLEAAIAAAPASPIAAIHPGIAEQYRRSIAELETAVTGDEAKPAAAEALRRLVSEVRLRRAPDGEMAITVHGELGALLGLEDKTKTPALRGPAFGGQLWLRGEDLNL